MKITITTKSGTLYQICERGDKKLLAKGNSFMAEIVRLRNPIKEGKVLEADLQTYSIYGQPNGISHITTTEIVSLEVNF